MNVFSSCSFKETLQDERTRREELEVLLEEQHQRRDVRFLKNILKSITVTRSEDSLKRILLQVANIIPKLLSKTTLFLIV